MTTPKRVTIDQVSLAANDYLGLLTTAERTTDDLIRAIREWEPDLVDALLQMREKLCRQVAHSTKGLDLTVRQAAECVATPDEHEKLGAIINHIEAEQRRLMAKQANCESALAAELQKVEQEMKAAKQKRSLRKAYHGQPSQGQARFLDARL